MVVFFVIGQVLIWDTYDLMRKIAKKLEITLDEKEEK
jgi:hypothetical protein